jgi:heat shock protein HtpX
MAKMSMGIQLIDPERPRGEAEAFLVEKVRNLSRQAGLPALPEIGVYDSPEVNAFATGPSASRALVAVSSGLLRRMDDRAVEGVLGHELSHVANGDMVTMTLIQGVVNAFVMFFARVIAFAIDNAMRSRDDDRRGGLGYFGYAIVVNLLEFALMFLAMPVVAWFSRWREYRADAGSARLAGAPTMIHALESLRSAINLPAEPRGALSAFKIHDNRGNWLRLIATHPPIEERIAALQRGPQ